MAQGGLFTIMKRAFSQRLNQHASRPLCARYAARRRPSQLIALATVAAALAVAPKAQAQDYWAGGNHDFWSRDNWVNIDDTSDTPNWSRTTDLYFGETLRNGISTYDDNGYVTNDITNDCYVADLNFYNQTWVLNGESLLFHGGTTIEVDASSPSVTISTNLKMDEDFINPTATLSLDVAQGSTLTISGAIYGTGALYKSNFGTAILTGFHNYTDGTNVDAGSLIDYAPQGNYRTNADLEFNVATDTNFTGTIFGGGSFTKSGAGTLTLAGETYYTGSTTVNGGLLIATTPWSSSNYLFFGGDLEFQTGSSGTVAGAIQGTGAFIKSGEGFVTLTNANNYTAGGVFVNGGGLIETTPQVASYDLSSGTSLEFQMNYDDYSWIGNISGAGSFIKSGTGTLLLYNANTYTGTTEVLGGLLIDTAPHGAAYLDAAALEFDTASDRTYSGEIVGPGSLTKSGSGTLTLTASYAGSYFSAYTGGTTVNEGRLIETNPHGDYVTNSDLEFDDAGDLVFQNPTTYVAETITGTGNFTKSGAGALTLLSPNGYSGSTTIDTGAIIAFPDNVLPTSTSLTVNANGVFEQTNGESQTVASLSGAGGVALAGTFTVNGAASTTFSGVILGNGSLIKSGAGTLTLSGVDTYTDGTTVSGGRLIDLNPHGSYLDNAALEFQTADDLTYATAITGSGSFTKSGAGTLTLSGTNTYGAGTTVNDGILIDDQPHGAYVLANNASLEFLLSDSLDDASTITGVGSFTKSGSGTLTLSGANTYTGGTTVNGGQLIDDNPHGNYVDDAVLQFQTATNLTYSKLITGTGSFTKSGAGVLTLTNDNTYADGTLVLAGTLIDDNPHGTYDLKSTLEFASMSDISFAGSGIEGFGSFIKAGAGTLTLTSAIDSNISVQLSSGTLKGSASVFRNVSSTGGTLQFDQAVDGNYSSVYSGSGSLLKTGSGAVTLSKAQTYTGGTTIDGGQLIADDPTGNYVTNAALVFAPPANLTYGGVVSGTGSLTLTGSRVVSMVNAPKNTGGVQVSGGSLVVESGGSFGGGLTVDAGATAANASGGTLTVGGRSYNQGTIDTASGSTTVFTGLVSGAGNFSDSGKVEFDGGFSPGNSPASVTFQGDMTLGSANDLTMELGGTTLGTGYDHLNVLGTAALGGALDVVWYGGFTASQGQTFDLFDFTHETGTFSSIFLPTLSEGLVWNESSLYTNGTIRVQSVPEPAPLIALGLGSLALLRCRRKS
jgi:fibronectin-binding autotransporter adhesin